MSQLVMRVLSLSLSGTLIGIVIMCICPVTKRFFSKKWNYYIWLLVVFRLLIPISFGPALLDMKSLIIPNRVTDLDRIDQIHTTVNLSVQDVKDNPTTKLDTTIVSQTVSDHNKVVGQYDWSKGLSIFVLVASYIWGIGVFIALLVRMWGYFRFRGYVQKRSVTIISTDILCLVNGLCSRMGLYSVPKICESDAVSGPVTIGLLQPVILLPKKEFELVELQMILHHELVHVVRKDLWYKWGYQLLLCIHWFNPFLYVIGRRINKDCELSCDEVLISQFTDNGKQLYGNVLLDAAQNSIHYGRSVFSTMFLDQKKDLKERLCGIRQYRKQTRLRILSSIGTFVLVLLLTICSNVEISAKEISFFADRATANKVSSENQIDNDDDRYKTWPDPSKEAWKVYDDDQLLAGEDIQYQWSAYSYKGGGHKIEASKFRLYGSYTIVVVYVPKDIEVWIGSSFELVKGNFKIVHIGPDNSVVTIDDTGKNVWQKVTMKEGRNVIKIVGQEAKIEDLSIDYRDLKEKDFEKIYYSEQEEYMSQIADLVERGMTIDKDKVVENLYYLEEEDVSELLRVLLEQGISLNADELFNFLMYSDSTLSCQYLLDAVENGNIEPLDADTLSALIPYMEGECVVEMMKALPIEQFYEVFEENIVYLNDDEIEECLTNYLKAGGTLLRSQIAQIGIYLNKDLLYKLDIE